ncbi:Serine phosphatase RsbU, regulator of sigma subunit [hydrothermal vent metagenome]|uniref:Serine phosphatase RsbU, regulator of sigma subunit n=1 Tax=hydrothermal vent metagenome TaxID=652676 RepID=A0A3B0XSD3_9ZZZZ
MPEMPVLVHDFILLAGQQSLLPSVLALIERYPLFFQRILETVNAGALGTGVKAESFSRAIDIFGFEKISELLQILAIYSVFNQYRINGIDMPAFWQDVLRRAVSARMLGELAGLDAQQCFNAGFMQDIGFILMMLEQPEKAMLCGEFRKREPEARLSMEQNIFNQQHDVLLMQFMQSRGLLSHLQLAVASHHSIKNGSLTEKDKKLVQVLQCADWLSAVFTADDKAYVINRCHTLLTENIQVSGLESEKILHSIPAEVERIARIYDIKITDSMSYSEIVYEANIQLYDNNASFQELTLRLDQALEERDKLAAEINRELSLAREIQQSLLPECRQEEYPVHGINCPARMLSGDFYDFFELENGNIYFNLGDVSGKGVNAALLMAKTCSLFRCLGKRIDEPGKLLYEINNELCETSIHGMFVTMVAGIYCPESDEIKLVNAGNPPALLFTGTGICREFEATAPPLGIMPDTVYTEYNITLKNDSLYLYSDGVTEGYVNESDMLGLSGLFKLIAGMDENLTSSERLKLITDKLTGHAENLRDDITVLLLTSG